MRSDAEYDILARDVREWGCCDDLAPADFLDLLAEYRRLREEWSNYLSYGQGGATWQESQWIDKVYQLEQRAIEAEKEAERLRAERDKLIAGCIFEWESGDRWDAFPDEAQERTFRSRAEAVAYVREVIGLDQ